MQVPLRACLFRNTDGRVIRHINVISCRVFDGSSYWERGEIKQRECSCALWRQLK